MSEANIPNIPAGWYPDPLGTNGDRWWDGKAWGGTSGGRQLVPGWYPEPGSGKRRWWDGERWGGFDTDRRATPAKRRVSQGGGVLRGRPTRRRWIKVVALVMAVAVLVVAGMVYFGKSTTSDNGLGYVTQTVNPTMGSMYGSTGGLLIVSHLPNGIAKFICLDGTYKTAGPGQTIQSPCVGHTKK